MIQERDFELYNRRFREYVNSLGTHDNFVQEHLDLKVEHTFRVADNIFEIARNTGLPDVDVQVAGIIALVHDIGRFKQFIKYRTFDDSLSANHAELGVDLLEKTCFLKELDLELKWMIYAVIMNHNVARLNTFLDKKTYQFAALIRDADKVDIWYILTMRDVVNKILKDQPQDEAYSVPLYILESYRKGIIVPYATTMNDYRLLRLSWIYDMNFPATFELILKRGYIDAILAKIPSSKEKDEIAGIIYGYVKQKAEAVSKAF